MKVLVIGGGGREHALSWALARDPDVSEILAMPGNPGIAQLARIEPGSLEDLEGSVALANRETPDLVVIGPEAPLVSGLADRLRAAGHRVFGPGADAARLEGSKAFAKRVMASARIPTARSGSFSSVEEGMTLVDQLGGRAVVKADGLAAGKGVIVAGDRDTARQALEACLDRRVFGEAGERVVIEEVLEGQEASAFALADGANQRGTLQQFVARGGKNTAFGDCSPPVSGAPDALQSHGDGAWRANMANQVNGANINSQFERSSRDQRLDFPGFKFFLGRETQLA